MKGNKPQIYEVMVRAALWMLMLLSICFAVRGGVKMASSGRVETADRPCVVIDAGHGGTDPGKVGVDGSLEKDINLQITRKLQRFLVMADVDVVLTRDGDAGLYDEEAPNKKVQDMKNRVNIIEEKKSIRTVIMKNMCMVRRSFIMRAVRRAKSWPSGCNKFWRQSWIRIIPDRPKPMTAIIF